MKNIFLAIFFFLLASIGCTTHSLKNTGSESIILALHKPFAKNVQFLSSLDGFKVHDAQRDTFGSWKITLPADQNFTYFYRIDGIIYIPDCTFKEFDDFGAKNCLYLP